MLDSLFKKKPETICESIAAVFPGLVFSAWLRYFLFEWCWVINKQDGNPSPIPLLWPHHRPLPQCRRLRLHRPGHLGNNMFAYCLNNPKSFFDSSGSFPIKEESKRLNIDGNIGENTPFDEYLRIKAKLEAAGIIIHYSREHALLSWSEKYLPLSREYEYVTFLYSIDTPQGERFFTTQTFKGTKQGAIMSPNVLLGTAILAIHNTISSANLLAHVHTHPCPPAGLHNDFPSYSQSIYGGDRIVFELLNLPEMYIFPYSTCTETSSMIVYSDKSTWCPFYS